MNVRAPLIQIEAHLTRYADTLRLPAHLVAAVRYALLGGGKRLRPLLAWWACEAVGTPGIASVPAGIGAELIHAFSLVHDDLPALDNDDLRRGRPTLHKHAGEAMAVLAGDAMMALAFQSLVESGLPAGLAYRLVRELADGTMGMIAGQVYDTLGGLDPAADALTRVRTIHANKTGALIRASVRMGAMCGLAAGSAGGDATKVDVPELRALTVYADSVGVVFQIADDLLDVEGTAEQTGKRTGKDAELGKLTYPGAIGIEASREQIRRLCDEALRALGLFGAKGEGLRVLCHEIANRSA